MTTKQKPQKKLDSAAFCVSPKKDESVPSTLMQGGQTKKMC
jgi:hypothetical protein